jgi:hypothetical protein
MLLEDLDVQVVMKGSLDSTTYGKTRQSSAMATEVFKIGNWKMMWFKSHWLRAYGMYQSVEGVYADFVWRHFL